MRSLLYTILILLVGFNTMKSSAQEIDSSSSITSRIGKTPPKILTRFMEAGMKPTQHVLTDKELKTVVSTIQELPPLHQKVLKKYLYRISFLDNMPNTALTAPHYTKDSTKLYTITVRAEILHQNVSEWLTEKERNCFDFANSNLTLSIDAGSLGAFLYVLLHETTHIVDGALELTPPYTVSRKEVEQKIKTNPFIKDVWKNRVVPEDSFQSDLLDKVYFKSLEKLSINKAEKVYRELGNSPFVSLYGRNSYHEDLAELVTIFHFTEKLGQEYRITINADGTELFSYEPMENLKVKDRLKQLRYFY